MPTPSGHTRAICAKTAIGTSVKDEAGQDLGKVEDIVLDKLSNSILFAVVGFGGMMGVGEKYHPIPWSMLDYDPRSECYRVSLSADQIKAAPFDTREELTRNDGVPYRDRAYDFYGVPKSW